MVEHNEKKVIPLPGKIKWPSWSLEFEPEVTQELRINVALEKAGLGSDGGELIIGGMSKAGINEWFGNSGSRGIDIFDVTVYGDDAKPSSLSGLRSTNNSLREVNITTDEDQEESYASLEIGNTNGNTDFDGYALKDVKILDATEMLGDLDIEAGLTPDIVGAAGKYAGNTSGFDYKLGQADNTLDMDMSTTTAAVGMDIESYGGDDDITVTVNAQGQANHAFGLDIETDGGDDTVDIEMAAQTSSAFLNYIQLDNITVDTGAGADEIYINDNFSAVDVTAGAGDDYIEVANEGNTASWLFNAAEGITATGPYGYGDTPFQFFGGKIVLEYQNIVVVQEIDTDANYVTTAAEINQAIKDAIDNNWELSQVLTYADVRNHGLEVSSTIDRAGQDLDVSFLAPKYAEEIAGDNDWTTGNYDGDSAEIFAERLTVGEDDMAEAWAAWFPDSDGIGAGSGVGTIYAGAADEQAVFQAMFDDLDYLGNDGFELAPFGGQNYADAQTQNNVPAETNSNFITMNVINAGADNDVIVLSSNEAGAFDTVEFDGTFGHNVIYNFNTGTAPGNIADFLDFTAYLDAAAATRGASATDPANARTTHQVGFTFNDWYDVAGADLDHNQVVHIDLAHLWPELEAAANDPGLPKTLAEMTAAQVERAMDELFAADVANQTTDEADMVGSTFVLMVTQDDIIDLQEEGVAELNGPLADPNLTKVFTVVVDAYDAADDEFSYAVTEQGLIEFAEMFSNLSDLNAANFSFTAEGQANIQDALENAGLIPEEDITPPELEDTDPADDAVDVPVDTDIVLTFDEDVQAGTGFIGIFEDGNATPVQTINVTDAVFDGNTVTVDLPTDLTGGTDYHVRIAPGAIEDLEGNDFAGILDPTELNFTTADVQDDIPPELVGTDPDDNAVDVAVDTDIVLTFDEDVQAGTGLIAIFEAGVATPVQTVDVTDAVFAGSTVTIDLPLDLEGGTDYVVGIQDGAIEDLAGNDYAGIQDQTTFNFTTAGAGENVVEMEPDGIYTATDGVVDVFQYEVDSSTGRVVGLDGEGGIIGFNVDEDRLEFVDAGDQLTTENFTNAPGVILAENPIQDTTTIGFDPSAVGSSLITIAGIQDAALDTIDFLVV